MTSPIPTGRDRRATSVRGRWRTFPPNTEDPALSSGNQKTLFWTYPIIKNELIYAGDIRNGLYILRYTGSQAGAVEAIRFLEGNSNLGDALRLSGGG